MGGQINAVMIDLKVDLAIAVEVNVSDAIDSHVLDIVVRYDNCLRIRCDYRANRSRRG
jgi:hypothetical protein